MTAPVVMVVGTASSVGKSTLVAALCRIAARRGLRVAPFKAQNMSNNAAVTADGGEIARSTATQAAAAGVPPTVAMNPILIKPESDRRSQVVVEGKVWKTLSAADYWRDRMPLWDVVAKNLDALRDEYDLVIAEGAGSPVELNLKARDIVNMRVARYAQARTLLVGDIDAGGIFAALLGTLMLLDAEERALVHGMVVNRFRGDPALFTEGVRMLEERGGVPVLGVVPWVHRMDLPEEDAVALDRGRSAAETHALTIAVLRLPHIANFDDFDPLAQEPGVSVRYITSPAELAGAAALIIPGTKATRADLAWLRERGFAQAIAAFGGPVVGICGGYQMLGESIDDALGTEGPAGRERGLGLLPVATSFAAEKRTAPIQARSLLPWAHGAALEGYEIHMGRTVRLGGASPSATLTARRGQPCHEDDGCASADARVWGCYIHGIFASAAFRHAWLATLGWQGGTPATPAPDPYDRLADVVEQHLDAAQLAALFRPL
ncbi:cobyric acid synthase [Chloroflexia bacterium SDU3-3]|nr:cobyric acid synthase [Chloroflexia bacterium SDU3-3]